MLAPPNCRQIQHPVIERMLFKNQHYQALEWNRTNLLYLYSAAIDDRMDLNNSVNEIKIVSLFHFTEVIFSNPVCINTNFYLSSVQVNGLQYQNWPLSPLYCYQWFSSNEDPNGRFNRVEITKATWTKSGKVRNNILQVQGVPGNMSTSCCLIPHTNSCYGSLNIIYTDAS